MVHEAFELVLLEHPEVLGTHEQLLQLAPVDREVQVARDDGVDHLSCVTNSTFRSRGTRPRKWP